MTTLPLLRMYMRGNYRLTCKLVCYVHLVEQFCWQC